LASGTEFDVIVVGAGPAGSACALSLAREGVNVLMLEKGKVPGERNMSGGVLYGDFDGHFGMINLLPDFEATAPLQRKIVSHEVLVLDRPDWKTNLVKYYRVTKNSLSAKSGFITMDVETGHDYTVLRRGFDHWMASLAVQAGAMLATETTVLDLLTDGGVVTGVRTTSEEIRSKLVVDCSGVTSTLVQKAGLRGRLVPRDLYHGTKRVYKLDPDKIEKRFKVKPGEGRSMTFLGSFMHHVSGGAFIYTNRDTLSVGVVASMDSLIRTTTEKFEEVGKLIDVQDDFESHPMVAELLEGAECVEYSAHNIPKGYKCILKKPYADGYLAAGDAMGAFVKVGPMIDGMRRAIASGMMAASAYLQASTSGSFRARNLSRYRDLLTPVYEDVNRSGRDAFISESSFTYNTLPSIIFGTPFMAKTRQIVVKKSEKEEDRDAFSVVQAGTSLLNYDEDKDFSHIRVDAELASKSITKPWVPVCPTNCYTLLTSKGVFASYKDLYDHDLSELSAKGTPDEDLSKKAKKAALEEIAAGTVRFDHVACVACGSCGAIGPEEMVLFDNERKGHGVRYAFG